MFYIRIFISDSNNSFQFKPNTKNMKTHFKFFLILLSIFLIYSCGKTSRDVSSNLDRVDIMFSQLKYDPTYIEYYNLISANSEIMIANSKKSGKLDTAVLNDKNISYKEKYEKLNYSNYNDVEKNTMKLYELYNIISKKFPDFKTLSEAEIKKLDLLSKKYYSKTVKK